MAKIIAMLVAMLLATATALPADSIKRYDGYKLYKILPQTEEHLQVLQDLDMKYNFWTESHRVGRHAMVSSPPDSVEEFEALCQTNNLEMELLEDDVQKIFDNEMRARERSESRAMEWSDFHTLDEIYAWLDDLEKNYTTVQNLTIGKTFEGRTIRGIKITNGAKLPGVIIEAGIHAREWSTPSATSWIINEILNSRANSTFRKFNYIYVPSLNPDGYVYTWTTDRLWRKTRSTSGGSTCIGTDANRNFDNHWMVAGASSNPCSETYAGPKAFSEIETASFRDFLLNLTEKYDLYIAFHSAAQLCIFPWGWTPQPAPLHDYWQRVGDISAAAIAAVNGNKFTVGDIYNTIYPASATSMDWYYGVFNNTIAYTFETMSRYGFELPAEYIIPTGKEHLAGLEAIFDQYLKRG